MFKYLPHHDDIYPKIALNVPNAQFVFLSHSSSMVTEAFIKRLAGAFEQFGLDADKYCLFLPRLNFDDFLNVNMISDVLLDTLEWSGGKTTLEAITCDLPIVTCPGQFMRGRHAYAFLKMMGVTETIAQPKKTILI